MYRWLSISFFIHSENKFQFAVSLQHTFYIFFNYRFRKDDIFRLRRSLGVPQMITLENGWRVDGLEALCITLQRYAYPCRYGDLLKTYGRPVPHLCMIVKWMTNFIYDNHGHLVSSLAQDWLSPQHLQSFANAIHLKGAALSNCWGFVDGTVRPICRPDQHQGVTYNGHKRIHALKFQSVTTPMV